ncbi:SpvB/TcaC N-terminal domain-containing protein [Streptomyces sp. NPDC058293]|uniref:SpvB/TcaC N-terminal domain-containing protein n=1 Tax=Streptomyces sp. NPDC058293 TaxID=3346429 RepID=UPI0036E1AC5C
MDVAACNDMRPESDPYLAFTRLESAAVMSDQPGLSAPAISDASDSASEPGHAGPQPLAISLPKGGGAIKGIGEKFAADPVTGAGSMTVPIAASPGRDGFGPQLSLAYDSGAGNGPFGLGWNLALPAITRKTEKGLPQYDDAAESDVFILSGAEDLVPVLVTENSQWVRESPPARTVGDSQYLIQPYRPRVEGLFARIERWTNIGDPTDVFWRSISRDNVTTWYGRTDESRIADPEDPRRIFSWLICSSHDDKGNVIAYGYKPENDKQVDTSKAYETNRERRANRYLKRVRYGNHTPYFPTLDPVAAWPALPADDQWYFELVFDYGDHDTASPLPQDVPSWRPRPDPFSSYRSGFEVRTYRLCQRVLMFHHFPDQSEVRANCLVRSTDLTYSYEESPSDSRNPIYSKLTAVTQRGYQRQDVGYRTRSLPPVEFGYTEAVIQTELRELAGESLEGLPVGLSGTQYQWVDLDGEGLPGILTEQSDGWFYKRNLSPVNRTDQNGNAHVEARFGALEAVTLRPALSLAEGTQFLDLEGHGRPDVVRLGGPDSGFYERGDDGRWYPFTTFRTLPNLDWTDPNLRFVDLDGDGHADVLITEHDALAWHPSLAKNGFGPERRVSTPWDEERGPALVFADSEESIYLADMSGDGLTDLVRIRNGEVCYWPNLGYGRFGPKVTMGGAPFIEPKEKTGEEPFDRPEQFDQRRVRLADIDGSGTTDIIYLHANGVRIYFNQSGNSWGKPVDLPAFPPVSTLTNVQALDLLGNGTACLVWSSPLPGDSRHPLRYVDLMGGQKPHLLVTTKNNLGAETEIQYAPSTKFYLQDKLAGTPWVTKLPFPVHVVERVTVRDKWRGTSFSSTYSHHHGYFDGPEREFRGFGRVEQVDVEDYGTFAASNASSPYASPDHRLYQPPVKTVTWYHTGASLDSERIIHPFEREYFPSWFEDLQPDQQVLGTFYERALPDPDLDAQSLTLDERREALRACKGVPLRQEIYELDVSALAEGRQRPIKIFSATSHTCHIQLLQPQLGNPHAVYHVTESEAISCHYELDLRTATLTPDPRITHTLNLKVDEYGNILQAVTVGYPRWQAVPLNDPLLSNEVEALVAAVQGELHVAYAETRYTDELPADPDSHRLPLQCEVLTYELTDVRLADAGDGRYFTLDKLRKFKLSDRHQADGTSAVGAIAYHELPDRTKPQKRLVDQTRSLFFDDAATDPLPFGKLNARALPYETYTLTLTDSLLTTVLGDKLTPDVAAALDSQPVSGYLSGSALTQRLGADTAGQYWSCSGVAGFNAAAPQHFFLPERYTDPFGNVTLLDYDPRDLYLGASTDAVGNRTEVVAFDFRVMAPRQIRDINNNLSEVRFDVLGMPTAMVLSGKDGEGDNLTGYDDAALNPDLATLTGYFVTDDYDAARAKHLLGGATTRHLYYLGENVENGTIIWAQHPPCAAVVARERHAADSPVQAAFEYSDGGGNVLVKKIQAEPALLDGPLRWIASGKTVLNNKGKPVKQYEPYFSPLVVGHRFEEQQELGVTPVLFYDAVGRQFRTDSPDGSYSRVEFSPWQVADYDSNDTVGEPRNAWYARMSTSAIAAERRAAQLASAHADTPSLTLLDSLGRTAVTIVHNREDDTNQKDLTFTRLDAEGKPLWVQDARGNRVMQYITPPLPGGTHPFDDAQNLTPQGFAPCYDIAGRLLFQRSPDAGDRWALHNAVGNPLLTWSSRGFRSRMTYDALHRPVGVFVSTAGDTTLVGGPRNPALPPDPEVLVQLRVYGETHPDASAYLRGKPYQVYDGSGVATSALYDFKGNLLTSERRFARDYKALPDWSALANLTDLSQIAAAAEALLESTSPLNTRIEYDALNRPTAVTTPDGSVYRAAFNDANLIERVEVGLRGGAATPFVTNIDYNARGQRVRIDYGNGATTGYDYEPLTFRLTNLRSTRPANLDSTASMLFKNATVVQDLRYTYDPVGNITRIEDSALTTSVQAGAACDYVYDALYRLIAASGREHGGQTGFALSPNDASQRDYPFAGERIHPNDIQGLRGYIERYRYDAVGNIMQLAHHAGSDIDQPGQGLWQRRYQYALDSNRLLATSLPGDPDGLLDYAAAGGYSARYGYDAHGNITGMTHLPLIRWDYKNQLSASAQQVVNDGAPETTYYVYDAGGERTRKVTETQSGLRKNERLYLGGYEIYREYSGGIVALERETLHVIDDKQRIAIVETATTPAGPLAIRYQLGNHLSSATVELDQGGALVAYEEYHPYGTTAFQTGRSAAEVSLKRYRYTAKERDDETGFSYHRARYYAPWLGRWATCDPVGGLYLFAYCANNPVLLRDPDGQEEHPPEMYQVQVTGQETPERVKQMFAARGIFYQGNATWVKAEGGGYWHLHTWQIQARDIGKQLNMRADPINSQKPNAKASPGRASHAQRIKEIREKKEQDWDAAKKGMWNAAVDIAAPPLPESLKNHLTFAEPAPTGDSLRDYELKESYEGGQIVTHAVAFSASLLPVGEMAEGAQMAASKLPKPSGGLGIVAQDFTSFSEAWASQANVAPKPPAPIFGNPQVTGPGHAEKMVETATELSHIKDAKKVFMHSRWTTITEGEMASTKLPDVAMVSESGGITAVEVPSTSDVRSAKAFGSLIARNLKVLRQMREKSEGLFIIFSNK